VHQIRALALVFLLRSCVFADQVSLKNGDRLTGTIAESDGKTLILHTDYADDITLKWNAIAGIQSTQELHVQLQNGQSAVGPVTTTDGKVAVATRNNCTVEWPIEDVKTLRNDAEEEAYEKTLHPGFLEEWNTGISVGFTLTRGSSATKNLSVGFNAVRQTLHDKLAAYENSVYATNDAPGAVPSTTANTAGGGVRYDHDLWDRIFAFGSAGFFADALQGLNLRSVLGGGVGYHAINNPETTLDFLAGANYTHESYVTLTRNFAALSAGEDLTQKIGDSTTLTQDLGFFPDLHSLGDYRATFDFGSITKLNKWLGWKNTFSDVYVTNPPLTKNKNALIFTTGLNMSLSD
jgi:putative salt-induced outer membrane protein YdiY